MQLANHTAASLLHSKAEWEQAEQENMRFVSLNSISGQVISQVDERQAWWRGGGSEETAGVLRC